MDNDIRICEILHNRQFVTTQLQSNQVNFFQKVLFD